CSSDLIPAGSGVNGSVQTSTFAMARNGDNSFVPAKLVTPAVDLRARLQAASGNPNGAREDAMACPNTPKPMTPTPNPDFARRGRGCQRPSRCCPAEAGLSR